MKSIRLKELIDYKHLFNKCVEEKDLKKDKIDKLISNLNSQNEIVLKLPENIV